MATALPGRHVVPGDLCPHADEQTLRHYWDSNPSKQDVVIAVIAKRKNNSIEIRRRDMRTLKGTRWLNDVVINAYFWLLVQRSRDGGAGVPSPPKVWAHLSFFYSMLRDDGVERVERHSKRSGGIFELDILLIPVHEEGHWTCGFLDFRKKIIGRCDPLGGQPASFFSNMRKYLDHEARATGVTLNVDAWTEQSTGGPMQTNNCDCGVFACQFANCLSLGQPPHFTQSNMPEYRRLMALELGRGRCYTTPALFGALAAKRGQERVDALLLSMVFPMLESGHK